MNIELIKDLSNAYGAPGFEDLVIKEVIKHKDNLTVKVDNFKNCYLSYAEIDKTKPTIMLDAHLDEVGFMVASIDENGLLGLQPLGGWMPYNVSSQLFVVRNTEGDYIKGVVSSKPPHFMSDSEKKKPLEMDELKIDVGATSRAEVLNQFKLYVGAPIVPFVEFEYNKMNGTMLGKAFDNRLGCAAVIAILKELSKEKDLPVNIVGALAAQEEVGLRGAIITSRRVKPDIAIVFEGSPSDDYAKPVTVAQSRMGHGPQIRHRDSSYIANDRLLALASTVAEDYDLPVQHAVRKGGGTNAGSIHVSNLGVPCLTLGIPSRYAHTHYLYASYEDFQRTVTLAVEVIKKIDASYIAEFEKTYD